ncbi:MAG: hypothetical protein NTY74_09065 [Ignavibacteriae bacterium]|nr:hypothetical protein [Ignavibacteriota bacterium]
MKLQKAIINFQNVKDNDLTEVAQLIYDKLATNPDFPTPPVLMPALKVGILDYSTALVKSKDGTKQDTAIKNAKRKILEGMLTENGNYVNLVANGDLVKLEGSGYPLTKVPAPIGILEQPKSFKVSDGIDPGTVTVENSGVEKSTGYIVLYYDVTDGTPPPSNDSEWLSKLFSKTTGLITGLKSGHKYMFKSAATSPEANKISLYNFTEPVERFVQ